MNLAAPMRVRGRVRVLMRPIAPNPFRPDAPREWYEVAAGNLVMTAGLEWYAERAIQEPSTTNQFDAFELYSGTVTPALADTRADAGTVVAGTLKRHAAGYPRRNDPDPDNAVAAGPLVLSFQTSYGSAEANGTIEGVVITNYANGAPAPAEPLLMHARFAAITKTTSDELKVIVNHTFS